MSKVEVTFLNELHAILRLFATDRNISFAENYGLHTAIMYLHMPEANNINYSPAAVLMLKPVLLPGYTAQEGSVYGDCTLYIYLNCYHCYSFLKIFRTYTNLLPALEVILML